MTDNEKELIALVREHDHPEQALITALIVVLDYLKQHGSATEPIVAALRALP